MSWRTTNERRVVAIAAVVVALGIGGCTRKPRAGTGVPAPVPALTTSASQGGAAPSGAPPATELPPRAQPRAVQQMRAWALGGVGANGPAGGSAQELAGAPDPKEAISGTIQLPTTNRARVARGDVMFLAARRLGGPPGPGSMLAVQKLVAEDFPMRFTLSARDAMIPGVAFEGQVSITVRVDKDGDALTRKKGDVTGRVDGVAVGTQDVVVSLATVESEDRTIASPDAVQRATLPPGHP